MWRKNITHLNKDGIFRSLNGAADENVFIAKASKAGFYCFFKVWRDMHYDAVLDYNGVLYRIETKGSSSSGFDFTRGGRSGQQINRAVADRKRRIEREDCDFVVCVDSNNGDCYIVPVDVLDVFDRENLSKNAISMFKEQWKLFMHDDKFLKKEETRDGLMRLSEKELKSILRRICGKKLEKPFKPIGTRGLKITNEKDILVLSIWYSLTNG